MTTALNLSPEARQYYISGTRWQADFLFIKAEMEFCRQLMDKWFAQLLNPEYIDQLKQLSVKLVELEREADELSKQLDNHLYQLPLNSGGTFPDTTERLADTHVRLEQLITSFTGDYRTLKRQLFSLVSKASKTDGIATSGIVNSNNLLKTMAQHTNKKPLGIKTHWGIMIIVALIIMLLLFLIFNILFKNPVY